MRNSNAPFKLGKSISFSFSFLLRIYNSNIEKKESLSTIFPEKSLFLLRIPIVGSNPNQSFGNL